MKLLTWTFWIRCLLSIQCIVFLSGCNNKIVNWGKQNFKQAKQYSKELVKAAKPYIRSTIVYDQFMTIATFEAIFLTDAVRRLYVNYHKKTYGMTAEKESLMQERMINENKNFISFYVLAWQPENYYESNKCLFTGEYQKLPTVLGENDAMWHVKLKVGDVCYLPESVRLIDLPIEYRHFFGRKYDQFLSTYLVRFAVKSKKQTVLKSHKAYDISLIFHSAVYETDMNWKNIVFSEH